MSLAAPIITSGQFPALDSNIFAIIAKLKRQSVHFLPNTPTAANVDLLSSLTSYPEPTADEPAPDFYIIAETPKCFRRFERIEIEDLKNEIIS